MGKSYQERREMQLAHGLGTFWLAQQDSIITKFYASSKKVEISSSCRTL